MDNMDNEENAPRTITVPAVEIIKKLRTKIDRQNFCRENSKFCYIIYRLVYTDLRARI